MQVAQIYYSQMWSSFPLDLQNFTLFNSLGKKELEMKVNWKLLRHNVHETLLPSSVCKQSPFDIRIRPNSRGPHHRGLSPTSPCCAQKNINNATLKLRLLISRRKYSLIVTSYFTVYIYSHLPHAWSERRHWNWVVKNIYAQFVRESMMYKQN